MTGVLGPGVAYHRSLTLFAIILLVACGRDLDHPGTVTDSPRVVMAVEGVPDKQILFGDLHAHTTFSMDAFEQASSMMRGEGLHPPADACDFARYCSQLDFWSINDHAVALTPERWRKTRKSVRQCNAVAGDSNNPDMVSYLGWEWTQIGATPESHFGHKNVVLKSLAQVPPRAIQAPPSSGQFNVQLDIADLLKDMLLRPLRDPANFAEHLDTLRYNLKTFSVPACDSEVASTDLPEDCAEGAATPADLFDRLDAWTEDYLVIPHGNTWGLYTPPASDWNKQLQPEFNHPRQSLIEIYSGHGSAEEYRSYRATEYNRAGKASCPKPTPGYVPCCWQAGEIVRKQCQQRESETCDRLVELARKNFVDGGASGYLTLSGVETEDWKNCGRCPDCFLAAFDHRPGTSAQAALAQRRFDGEQLQRFRWGFIASSDNHTARPGSGYKEMHRRAMTDAQGASKEWAALQKPTASEVRSVTPALLQATQQDVYNRDRVSSFMYTGGLVAVHSRGRNRDAIWDALQRREVYGTSGPRILLWFDLLGQGGDVLRPMGGGIASAEQPHFRIRAQGSWQQLPGCSAASARALGAERLQRLCYGECYNPAPQRHRLDRLEVVRIRPQLSADEALVDLIDDPWRVFPCSETSDMCIAEFQDTEYRMGQRDSVYYVRAIQSASEAVNGGDLRCEYDDTGQCITVNPCHGDFRQQLDEDCLAPIEERAWSSPIFLDYPASQEAG